MSKPIPTLPACQQESEKSFPLLLRRREILALTSLSDTLLWRLVKRGDFPAPLQVGPRAVRWRSDEVEAWLEALPRTTAAEGDTTGEA